MTRIEKKKIRGPALVVVAVGLLVVFSCTERNPHYDPDAYCEPGIRKCDPDTGVVLVCTSEGKWPLPDGDERWIIECWEDAMCFEGRCVPDEEARVLVCEHESDCSDDKICSPLVSPEDISTLAGYCIRPPYPEGREAGRPCNTSTQCMSGRCTRNVCLEMCTDSSDCSVDGHDCVELDLTVDGIRYPNIITGCVPQG